MIDFHYVKATDLKSNKRVNLVINEDLVNETKCEYLKMKLKETYKKWANENDNANYRNIDDYDRQGLKELQDCIENN